MKCIKKPNLTIKKNSWSLISFDCHLKQQTQFDICFRDTALLVRFWNVLQTSLYIPFPEIPLD